MAVQRFPSKVDAWLAGVAFAGPAIAIVAVGLAMLEAPRDVWPGLVVALLAAGMVAWIFTSACYEIGEGYFVARSGPFRFRRPLGSISRVRTSRNMLSSPALSLDRMEIQSRAGSLLISPRDKAAFLRAHGFQR